MRIVTLGASKIGEVEARLGKSILDYFSDAVDRGLNQREMAAETGVSRQTISNWMRMLDFKPAWTYQKPRGRRRSAA